jgi:hypothetical protein
MKRRDFIAGLGGAAAWPAVVRAQQGDRVRRIGVLMNGTAEEATYQAGLAAFVQGLRQRGPGAGWPRVVRGGTQAAITPFRDDARLT